MCFLGGTAGHAVSADPSFVSSPKINNIASHVPRSSLRQSPLTLHHTFFVVCDFIDLQTIGCLSMISLTLRKSLYQTLAHLEIKLSHHHLYPMNPIQVTAFLNWTRYIPMLRTLAFPNDRDMRINDMSLNYLAENCPRIISLDIRRCHRITDHSIENIALNCRELKYFDASYCSNITDDSLALLTKNCPHLQTLSLDECSQITSRSILNFARHCLFLNALSMNSCRGVTDLSVIILIKFCPSLKKLSLKHCINIKKIPIMTLITTFPSLQSIDFGLLQSIITPFLDIIQYQINEPDDTPWEIL